jgi:hypothetical protein
MLRISAHASKGGNDFMSRSIKTLFSVLIAALLIPGIALAAPKANISASGVSWQAASEYDGVTLVVSGPSGAYFTKDFTRGQAPSFSLKDIPANLAVDGTYTFELRYTPRLSADVKKALADARERGDDAAATQILKDAAASDGLVQSGALSVLGGNFVTATENQRTPATNTTGGLHAGSDAKFKATTDDQVIADDLIVQGSACVGLDCVNNESFGFDTIRLKENNTRIKFDDTSTTAGCPANDWQLTANDACGGASKFSIEDITGSKVPFTITAGAATNSIFVDSTGRLGLRTSTPVLDVHISTSNTPAMRYEQTNAGGFTAQTWDVAGNEANFFVRDVTGGSRLPFRIRPGAPTSSIDIAASGQVGIGTASPSQKLHVLEAADVNTIAFVQNANVTSGAAAVVRTNSDTAQLSMFSHSSARVISRFGQTIGGWNELLSGTGNGLIVGTLNSAPLILGTNSAARMTIDSSGNITVPGNFTVTGVKNFAVVDPTDSKQALYYTALEGPEAGTYFRGSAKTVNGEVVIALPDYFSKLTEAERMTVQLTPVGGWGQIYVASKSPDKIVIKTAKDSGDLQFDYLVQGVRKGYLNYEVERTGAFPVKP